jgi:thiol-disulfide isomerase/thioredoxin
MGPAPSSCRAAADAAPGVVSSGVTTLPPEAALSRVPVRIASILLGLAAAAATDPQAVLPSGDLAAFRERVVSDRGHPLLLNFWATWCPPCLKEIPVLNRLQADLGPSGARFLAVSLDPLVYPDPAEAREKVTRAAREGSFELPLFLYDGDPEALGQAYDLPPGLPHTLLLGPDGAVLDRVEGQIRDDEAERLAARIRAALGSSR